MKMTGQRYTEKELVWITRLFEQGRSDEEIATTVGRTVYGIRWKREKMGLFRPSAIEISKQQGHKWTDEEILFIKNYWNSQTDEWMAKKLGVTVRVYRLKRQKMTVNTIDGSKRLLKSWIHRKGRHITWTWGQEEFLREHYPTHGAADIARYVGHTKKAVIHKANRMGITKDYKPGEKGYPPVEQYYNSDTFQPKIIK